jgi:hypothetical protein
VLIAAADSLFPCLHRHITLPMNNRQTCLDCGATRHHVYAFDTDFSAAGIFIGKWRVCADSPAVTQRLFARKVHEKANHLSIRLYLDGVTKLYLGGLAQTPALTGAWKKRALPARAGLAQ